MITHLLFSVFVLFLFASLLTNLLQLNLQPPRLPAPRPPRSKPRLRLTENGTFNVAIFSDLHYGEDEYSFGPEQDRKSTEVMAKLLGYEKPDFVVINGDLITGENTHKENSTVYVDQLFSPLVAQNYTWASTYGNHDTQFNLSREALFCAETKYEGSYTRHGPEGTGGVTNYWLAVYPAKPTPTNTSTASTLSPQSPVAGEQEIVLKGPTIDKNEEDDEKPILILWFFDSQGGSKYQVPHWIPFAHTLPNWVTAPTVSWFTTQNALLQSLYGPLPSLAFVHIPPTAFLTHQRQTFPKKGGKDGRFPGLNDDVPVANQGEGRWGWRDWRFMDVLKEVGVHSVYSGHDHGNSWCGVWPGKKGGPKICFVKHTGYGGYGTWRRGSRVLGLSFGGGGEGSESGSGELQVESWVRLEEGDIVQRISLNETYGLDIYPADDGED